MEGKVEKIRLIEARIRNIPYYKKIDEEVGRKRVNYMFALRGLKDLLLSLSEEEITDRYSWFIKLLTRRRITSDNSESFINTISKYESKRKKKAEKEGE